MDVLLKQGNLIIADRQLFNHKIIQQSLKTYGSALPVRQWTKKSDQTLDLAGFIKFNNIHGF